MRYPSGIAAVPVLLLAFVGSTITACSSNSPDTTAMKNPDTSPPGANESGEAKTPPSGPAIPAPPPPSTPDEGDEGDDATWIGREAPDFTLPNQDDVEVALADARGKWLVIYFYPKDDTPG